MHMRDETVLCKLAAAATGIPPKCAVNVQVFEHLKMLQGAPGIQMDQVLSRAPPQTHYWRTSSAPAQLSLIHPASVSFRICRCSQRGVANGFSSLQQIAHIRRRRCASFQCPLLQVDVFPPWIVTVFSNSLHTRPTLCTFTQAVLGKFACLSQPMFSAASITLTLIPSPPVSLSVPRSQSVQVLLSVPLFLVQSLSPSPSSLVPLLSLSSSLPHSLSLSLSTSLVSL
eukprot:6181034-Pleurochrysis_carterae.AAC.2